MLVASTCRRREPLARVLAIGCHADDIEIGCGGTLLTLTRGDPELEVTWVVLAAPTERARRGARERRALPRRARATPTSRSTDFRDGFLPYAGGEVKDVLRGAEGASSRDLVLTHTRDDLHQDHRLACELTGTRFATT